MSTTASSAHRPAATDRPADPRPGPRTGPIRRIIATSLATGLVGALALTLVVFGGEPEHVITGSALLAFAFGWALLAVLPIRMTDQPQRWALVPAAGMAVTGLGLMVLAPGDGALTGAGWVWPPTLLAWPSRWGSACAALRADPLHQNDEGRPPKGRTAWSKGWS
jgi:hypothetical protein